MKYTLFFQKRRIFRRCPFVSETFYFNFKILGEMGALSIEELSNMAGALQKSGRLPCGCCMHFTEQPCLHRKLAFSCKIQIAPLERNNVVVVVASVLFYMQRIYCIRFCCYSCSWNCND